MRRTGTESLRGSNLRMFQSASPVAGSQIIKRWMLGTHQGAIGYQHLDDYLNEFVFRFNRRKSASRGKLFFRLAQHALQIAPTTYERLVRPQDVG